MDSIITECLYCLKQVEVPVTAKILICPHCGEEYKFNAEEFHRRLKMIMKKAFGPKPANPSNN